MLAPTQGQNVIMSQPNVSESFMIYRHMTTSSPMMILPISSAFLAFEMVHSLTVVALDVKKGARGVVSSADLTSSHLLGICKPNPGIDTSNNKCRHKNSTDDVEMPLPVSSLFVQPPEARTPLQPSHIQDVFAPTLAVESINGQQ